MHSRTKKSRLKTQSGQAVLIGLIVTIAIIAILAAIMYPKMAGRSEYTVTGDETGQASPLDRADDTACISYQSQINDAIAMYNTDHSHPPRSMQDLKKYGVTNEMINTPNCNFVLPKYPQRAPASGAPSMTTVTTPGPNLVPVPGGVTTVTTVTTVNNAPAPTGPAPGSGPPPPPAGGNNILPTKMGRSIPLDGGSSAMMHAAGDDRGNGN